MQWLRRLFGRQTSEERNAEILFKFGAAIENSNKPAVPRLLKATMCCTNCGHSFPAAGGIAFSSDQRSFRVSCPQCGAFLGGVGIQ